MFTGQILDAQEALDLGIVNYSVENPTEKAMELAKKILTKGPIAIRMAKLAMNQGYDTNLATGLQIEQMCYAQVIPTKDRLEGLAAFKEKRSPVFKGE